MSDPAGRLYRELDATFGDRVAAGRIRSESDLCHAIASRLGQCQLEVPFIADPPKHRWPAPPDDIRHKLLDVPDGGFDPIASSPYVDMVWSSESGPAVVEVKFAKNGEWDTYGYQVLRDVFRLERLRSVAGGVEPRLRFVAFVSKHERWWNGGKPTAPQINEGRVLDPGSLVQYSQDSALTRWGKDYAPFRLANRYEFHWQTLVPGQSKCLIVPVAPQH